MPKISRKILGKYNKSCSAPYQESSKIEFAIFRIFYDFLENLQDSAISLWLLKFPFCTRTPRSFTTFTTIPLVCTKHPRKIRGLAILPLAVGVAWLAGIRETDGAPGRGRGQARPHAHLGPGGSRSWGGGVASEGARRRPTVVAAAARVDGEGNSQLGNKWVLEL
jgi:hypothetical protein